MKNFKELFRVDTGSHFLDSGCAYGRHHQKPDISSKTPAISMDVPYSNQLGLTICTAVILDEMFIVDHDMFTNFKSSEYEDIEEYVQALGYIEVVADNSYNWESDLDQCFMFKSYQRVGTNREWLYDNDAVVLLSAHNGCDVRGGYTEFIPILNDSNYKYGYRILLDVVGGWSATRVWADGIEVSGEDLWKYDEQYQPGYCSSPTCKLNNDIEVINSFDMEKQEVDITLKNGVRMIVTPTL